MSNSSAQVRRLLALVPYLQRHQTLSLTDIAHEFGVKPQQILRDLKVLWFCGLPGLLPDDLIEINMDAIEEDQEQPVKLGNADFLSRPIQLEPAEVAGLQVALESMRQTSSSEAAEIIDSALAKLAAVARQDAPAELISAPAASPALRDLLSAAARDGQAVSIDYYVPRRDSVSTRTIDPVEVFVYEGIGYVDAWCHQAGARRTFRLDRIFEFAPMNRPASGSDLRPHPAAHPPFSIESAAESATIEVSANALWITDCYPHHSSDPSNKGGAIITLPVADRAWLIRLILRMQGEARIIEPAVLAQDVAGLAELARARYA